MTQVSIESRLDEAFASPDVHDLTIPGDGVVAVILAYNEALRFPYFLEHYRALGIAHFIVIDNNSADGTRAILSGCADVSVIGTEKPYRDYKSDWRQLICERYLEDRWVIFPDVDELFVYPGWPDRSIDELVRVLDDNDHRALFCPMVDMYPKGPLKDLKYRAGDSFLEASPYFDGTGYRYCPLKGSHRKRYKSPSRHLFGGTRERLFHQDAKRSETFLDRALLRRVFSIRAHAPETAAGRFVDHLLFKLVKDALPDTAAVQSKIPLIKWRSDFKFSGGVHGIDKQISVAPEWGALLHFKYLDDFQSKVTEAIARKQHTDDAGHYRDYNTQMTRLMDEGLYTSQSVLFSGIRSLIDHGLLRDFGRFDRQG
ncbi:glycosyltransferase family 2 protein [Roseibium sp. MMSF_3412]|uniref:glycosyltransferase family 2 protein n=1 Tax=Roseibium sp. MMSF_3412 TaxID=3046712 RepID=UPI00273D23CB|nr:glycosyltransferase family 2 protein [Roseibium sp. MMSF_3412]